MSKQQKQELNYFQKLPSLFGNIIGKKSYSTVPPNLSAIIQEARNLCIEGKNQESMNKAFEAENIIKSNSNQPEQLDYDSVEVVGKVHSIIAHNADKLNYYVNRKDRHR